MRGVAFDVKMCTESVESYLTGRKTVGEIAREKGMSEATFFNKLREFRKKGRIDPAKPSPANKKRTQQLSDKLTELKKDYPNYGRTRLTRELLKEKELIAGGQSLSEQTTWRALKELNLQLPPKRGDYSKQKSRHNYQKKQ